ncbi:hypothetical protein ES702_02862 [subsurface metagenome]
MKNILASIDRRIDKLRLKNNFSRNNNYLELTESEYKILKKSFIPDDLLKGSKIITYRKIPIKVIKSKTGEKRTEVLTQNAHKQTELPFKAGEK